MPVTAVGATSATNNQTAAPYAEAGANTKLDREVFLKLLVAQLKYQDPTKPVDASEMISQSAQLSVVDKLEAISAALAAAGAANRLTLGSSVIGKQITFAGTGGVAVTETVTAVSFDGTNTVLHAGSWDVPLDAVLSIADARGAAAATPEATTPPAAPPPAAPAPAPADPAPAPAPADPAPADPPAGP